MRQLESTINTIVRLLLFNSCPATIDRSILAVHRRQNLCCLACCPSASYIAMLGPEGLRSPYSLYTSGIWPPV